NIARAFLYASSCCPTAGRACSTLSTLRAWGVHQPRPELCRLREPLGIELHHNLSGTYRPGAPYLGYKSTETCRLSVYPQLSCSPPGVLHETACYTHRKTSS